MKKLILFTLITLSLGILLILGAMEWYLRKTWSPPPESAYDYSHPYIRNRFKAGVELPILGDDLTGFGGTFVLKCGPIGYRTNSILTREKPEGHYRIFFLGGSTTACVYLPQELTFSQKVEDQLNAGGPQLKVDTANAGADGHCVRDTLAILDYDVSLSSPDCVVMLHGINDLRVGLLPGYCPDGSEEKTKLRKAKYLYRETFGDPYPYLYHWFKSWTSSLEKRQTVGYIIEKRRGRVRPPSKEIVGFPNLKWYQHYMRLMAGSCKSLGIRLIFMTQPSLYKENMSEEELERLGISIDPSDGSTPSVNTMIKGIEVYNNATRELAAELGVELIDLDQAIPKTLENIYDECHFTAQGCEKVAEVISGYLASSPPLAK